MNIKRKNEKLVKKFEKKFLGAIQENGFTREEYSQAVRSVSTSDWYKTGNRIYRAKIKTPSTIDEVLAKALEQLEFGKIIEEEE